MSSLLVRTLGPLEALVDGLPVRLGGSKQRAVLACLALRANTPVSTEVLREAVWLDRPPAKPAAVLQVYIANLRKVLDPDRHDDAATSRLTRQAAGYSLTLTDTEADLLRFRRLVSESLAAAQATDLTAAAEALRTAVQLFRGPAFPDLADVDLLQPELVELEERRLTAHEDLIDIELALGRHASILGEVQLLVTNHQFRERLWASLVLALYRSERQAEALAACHDARRMLIDELGIDPSPTMQELELAVLRQDSTLNAPAQHADRRQKRRIENLPAPLTPIVGRDGDLAALDQLFGTAQTRMVTITGPGGAGKTRFALAVASRVGLAQPDGVSWVDLAPLTDASQVAITIARAVGMVDRADTDVEAALIAFLQERRMLLVLDNFEHVEAAWPIIPRLLTTLSQLLILVTSRRTLQLRAEHNYELPALAVPGLDPPPSLDVLRAVPAVELFVNRAAAVRRDFQLTGHNAATVSRLCHRLDGLPLAIELAAAQLRHWSEDQLLTELDTSLTTIPAALRDLPDRQQTLAATIAWSYQLLNDDERGLFNKLAIFAGDPTTTAVAMICDSENRLARTDSVLSALGDHSLLRCYVDAAGTPRLAVLQSIREYARSQLRDGWEVRNLRQRHAAYFLAVAEALGPQLLGPHQADAVRGLQAENDDIRAALHWASGPDGSIDIALRLISHLWHYWERTGEITGPGNIAQAVIAQAGRADAAVIGPALSGAATLSWLRGNIDDATKLHGDALDAFRRTGDQEGVAWSLMCLAVQALERGSLEAAGPLIDEVLTIPEASNRTQASAHMVLGAVALWAGDLPGAQARYEQSLHLARRMGDQWTLGKVLVNLAYAAEVSGDYDTAANLLHEALRNSRDIDDRVIATYCVEGLATLQLRRHRPEEAARLFAATEAYRAEIALPLNGRERERTDAVIEEIRAAAGPIRFAVAWTAGEALTLTQAVGEALREPQVVG